MRTSCAPKGNQSDSINLQHCQNKLYFLTMQRSSQWENFLQSIDIAIIWEHICCHVTVISAPVLHRSLSSAEGFTQLSHKYFQSTDVS